MNKLGVSLALLGHAFILGGAAYAQGDGGEIVVTAQKREQLAQDVAITLNAFGGEELSDASVFEVPDIARLTPGVNVSGSFAGQSVMFSIRGVTQQDFSAHAEAPVAVYLDEGYLAANNAAGIGLFDVERVEVLKGPQGTLFGRNATGGLVSITTRAPTEDPEYSVSARYASYNDVRLEAAASGPLAKGVQGRIAALYQSNDGWLENDAPSGGDLGGREQFSVRGRLALQPSDDVSVLLTAYASDVEQSWGPYLSFASQSVLQNGVPNAIEVGGPISFFGNPQPPGDADDLRVRADSAQDDGAFNRIAGGTARIDWSLGDVQVTSVTDYKRLESKLLLDDDATALRFFDTATTADVENWSQEVRFFQDAGTLRWTAGAYYLDIAAESVDLQRLFGLGGVQVSSPFALDTQSLSAFGLLEYDLAPSVTLTGGLRATQEDKDYRYAAEVQAFDGTPIVAGRTFKGDSSDTLYSWKLGVEWRPADDILLFATYNRGVKAGGFNAPFAGGATPPDAEIPYDPEELDAYEIGAKTTLLDDRLVLNGAVFYYDYTDYQAFKFVNFSAVVTNNAATAWGAELEANFQATDAFELMAGVSYVDNEVEGVPISNSVGSAVVSRRAPFTSEWRGVTSARYVWPLAGGELSLQADAQYTGDYYFSLSNFDATEVDAYTLVNARVAWSSPSGRWEVAAFGQNLTDERYRTVGFEASDFGGFTQVGYGEPLWVGASVTHRFP